jgi:hypothetical protein
MQTQRTWLAAAMLLVLAAMPRLAADEVRVTLPEDVKFAVQLDAAAIQKSAIGSRLIEGLKAEVLGDLEEDEGLSMDKIVEILGFDPFEEVQSIAVAGSDYEAPEKSLVGCVQLRSTTGNLEGLLLSLPGYDVEEVDGAQIHSARPEEDMPVYGAFHEDDGGSRTVVLGASRDAVVSVLGALDGEASGDDSSRAVTLGEENAALVSIQVFELPEEIAESEGPQANIAKVVRSGSLRITEADENVRIVASIVAGNDKQAEQLEQAARGLGAMIGLAAANDPDDEDLKMVQQVLKELNVSRDGDTVELNLSVPDEVVMNFIEANVLD